MFSTAISLNEITVFLSLSLSTVGSKPELSWVALSFATKTSSYGLSTLSIQSSTVTLAMRVIYTWKTIKSSDFYIFIGFKFFLIKNKEIIEIKM